MTLKGDVQQRTYPEVRIRERGLSDRIFGVLCVFLGLAVVAGGVVLALLTQDLWWLAWGMPLLIGLVLIYYGLHSVGLNLWE